MSEANQTESKESVVKTQVQNLSDLASFSTFVVADLSNGQQVSMQLNYRHGMPEDVFFDDFQKWYRILDRISQDGGDKPYAHFWNGAQAKPAQPVNPDLPAAPALPSAKNNGKTARKWDEPIPQAELPVELAEVTVDVFTQEFDVVEVLPQPDDKVTVNFWKDGLEFPVGAKLNKAKLDTARQYLAGLTEAETPIDVTKPAKLRIAGTQFWTKGSEYTITQGAKAGQKSFYKNIALLKPAF